jgi:hypothetical protein
MKILKSTYLVVHIKTNSANYLSMQCLSPQWNNAHRKYQLVLVRLKYNKRANHPTFQLVQMWKHISSKFIENVNLGKICDWNFQKLLDRPPFRIQWSLFNNLKRILSRTLHWFLELTLKARRWATNVAFSDWFNAVLGGCKNKNWESWTSGIFDAQKLDCVWIRVLALLVSFP